jgi:hypothetical protein
MSRKHLIALSGWKRSGKDASASILLERGFERLAFADSLKDMVADQYKIPNAWMYEADKKEAPLLDMPVMPQDAFSTLVANYMVREFRTQSGEVKHFFDERTNRGTSAEGANPEILYWTPRALCILEGSVKRSVNSSYWVQHALRKASGMGNIVLTDMRYRSEVEQIQSWSLINDVLFTSIRINRFANCESVDPSERDLDDAQFDFIINNTGTLDDLANSIYRVVELVEMASEKR